MERGHTQKHWMGCLTISLIILIVTLSMPVQGQQWDITDLPVQRLIDQSIERTTPIDRVGSEGQINDEQLYYNSSQTNYTYFVNDIDNPLSNGLLDDWHAPQNLLSVVNSGDKLEWILSRSIIGLSVSEIYDTENNVELSMYLNDQPIDSSTNVGSVMSWFFWSFVILPVSADGGVLLFDMAFSDGDEEDDFAFLYSTDEAAIWYFYDMTTGILSSFQTYVEAESSPRVEIYPYEEPKPGFNEPLLYLMGAIVAVGSVFILGRRYWIRRQLEKINLEKQHQSPIPPIFGSLPQLYQLFLGQAQTEGDVEFPEELFTLKHLFHPVRLAIVKLLTEYDGLTPPQLKQKLKISNNELYYAIKNLEEKALITQEQEFINQSPVNMVYLTSQAIVQFEKFKELLYGFLGNTKQYEEYLDSIIDVSDYESDENLYPGT